MTSGWGLQQRPTSPITKKYSTQKKIKIDNEHELSQLPVNYGHIYSQPQAIHKQST